LAHTRIPHSVHSCLANALLLGQIAFPTNLNLNKFDITQPLNSRVLEYLGSDERRLFRKWKDAPIFAPPSADPDPYMDCGCHPDIVTYMWDHLAIGLPTNCRGLVYGTPALVHSKSRVILALGMGTQYGLRLPGVSADEGAKKGLRMVMNWSDGTRTNIQNDFGEDWYFGSFDTEILTWCKIAYELFDIV
jgi:hypothetical protein